MAELDARVACEDQTRTRLRQLKEGAETYDEVINRLIREAGYADSNN